MLAMLLSIVFSVVPAKYRGRALTDFSLDVQRGALVSSLLQMIGSLAIIIFRYPSFAQARALEMTAAAAAKGHDQTGQAVAIYAGGVMGVFEYLLHPLTFILAYFAIEGQYGCAHTLPVTRYCQASLSR
ncbi:MAG TPA: hypothetical protein VM056_06715 [Terriglobales bacterium]|nr:hypothetical protein [Terriglobales bacterium]